MYLFSQVATKARRWLIQIGCIVGVAWTVVLMLVSPVAAKQSDPEVTRLVINIPSFTLSMMEGNRVTKRYPVAVGKPSAPTPLGQFRIINKAVNPTWYPPDGGRPVPPGAANPLGRRWLGFLPNGYGIHGNNNESSIGKAVSLGCVRMHNADVEELFARIPVGTELRITYETADVEVDPTTGQTHLVFYPDIYRRGTTAVVSIEEKLRALGLAHDFDVGRITAAIEGNSKVPRYVCLGMKVQVGRQEIIIDTEVVNGETLLAGRQVLEAFSMPVVWDAGRRAVVSGSAILPAHVRDGQSFLHLSDLEEQLGIKSQWHETGQLELFTWQVTVKQKEVAGGVWKDVEGIWLAVDPIAQALELPVAVMLERTGVMDNQGREWSGKVFGEDIHVSPETLTKILPVRVIILEDEKRVEIESVSLIPPGKEEIVPVSSLPDIFFQEQDFASPELN